MARFLSSMVVLSGCILAGWYMVDNFRAILAATVHLP